MPDFLSDEGKHSGCRKASKHKTGTKQHFLLLPERLNTALFVLIDKYRDGIIVLFFKILFYLHVWHLNIVGFFFFFVSHSPSLVIYDSRGG